MLKFDSLEIIGFKSFADKTRVVFDDRITCVVGPNGCGKSNLADAVGWVLGVQNARLLRGDKMEDVIFNGAARRKPSGIAEITLTMRRIGDRPIVVAGAALAEDRAELTRKVFRSGESHYLINQRRCRLKDLQQFLEDSALGFASYAVIAQGHIESFLTAKPMDRRLIIEEAAGIAGYKSKRRCTELKLDLAQQNLLRINDIVAEVERQLRALKRQAAKARRYRELKEEFRQLQRRRIALEARDLAERLSQVEEELDDVRMEEDRVRRALQAQTQNYRRSTERRELLEKQLYGLRQDLNSATLDLDRAQNSIQYHREQIEATARQLEAAASEQRTIESALVKTDEELAYFQSQLESLKEEEASVHSAVEQQTRVVERNRAETKALEQGLDDFRARYLRLSAEAVTIRNAEEQARQRIKALTARRDRLAREIAANRQQMDENSATLEEVRREADRRQSERELVLRDLQDQEHRKRELDGQLNDALARVAELQSQAISFRERLQSLQEIELSHSQYSEGVQQFLNHLRQNPGIRTVGTLADSIETTPEYERFVEEVLSQELEFLLVDSLDDAARGVNELKTLKGGKCTFLCLRSSNGFGRSAPSSPTVPADRDKGVHGTLGELLRMRSEVETAFRRVLPERADAVVVSDLDHAFELAHSYPESTFLTLEGETLTPRGMLSARAVQPKQLGLLSLKRQKLDVETRLSKTQSQLKAAQERAALLQDEAAAVTAASARHQDRLHELDKELVGLVHQKRHLEGEAQRLFQARRVLDQEAAQLELEEQQHTVQAQGLVSQLAETAAAQAEVQGLMSEHQNALQQIRGEFELAQGQLHAVSSSQLVLAERRTALERTLRRVGEQRLGLEKRRLDLAESESKGKELQRTLRSQLEAVNAHLEQRRRDEGRLRDQLGAKDQDHADWKASHARLEEELAGLREQAVELQEQRSQLEVEEARQDTQLEGLRQHCLETLQVALETVAAQTELEGRTSAEIEQEYQDLKRRLDDFGPVNMTALDDYRQNEERFTFLTRQREDIQQSIADTTRAIQEINRRSRERFRHAFEAVNANFKEVFAKLFGGGECGIQLLGEEDILECGLDVYAQPPGKKIQNIMLLSGGEKAMTVLALLVALFQYRPSQFCLLDEVDAPLDDANVARFAALVQEMSAKTQFIVVTHNKRTMEVANCLYGVTMDEPGVSQVVSVKF